MKKWIWEPPPGFAEKTNVYRFMRRIGFTDREAFLRFSSENPEAFWDATLKEIGVEWFTPFDRVLDTSRGVEWARWFTNGKLNIAANCLDRHARGPSANHVACLWESEDGSSRALTFAEVYAAAS